MSMQPATVNGRKVRQRAIARNGDSVPSDAVDRILSTYAAATYAEKLEGLAWYYVANDAAHELATLGGVDVNAAAGVLAALSPQTSWVENLARAHTFMETGDTAHFQDAVRKAERCANGEAPLSVLGGRKVRSFYRNIAYPDYYGPVTVDRHAVAICHGRVDRTDTQVKSLERPGVYHRYAGAYRSAARRLGILPSQVQAITWVAWRRDHAWERTGETF